MRYSNRFFLYAPIALLLSLAAAAGVWWDKAATSLNDRLVADNGREIMPGVTMRYASKSVNGFPFNLDTVLDGFVLQIQMRTGPLVWRSEHFAMHSLTYAQSRQIFEAAGKQELEWTDSEGAHHRFTFVPGSLRASAVMNRGALSRFDFDMVAMNSPDISAQRLQFHIRKAPDKDALDFVVDGDGFEIAPTLVSGFGDTIQHFSFSGKLSPSAPLRTLLGGDAEWRNALESWRRQHGTLVADAQIAWSPITADGVAHIGLDDQHRPAVDIRLSVVGADALAGSHADPRFFSGRLALAASAFLPVNSTIRPAGQRARFATILGNFCLERNDRKYAHLAPGLFWPLEALEPLY